MNLAAGKLRHRVRIEKNDFVRDSDGDVVQDPVTGAISREWVPVATVWAAIEPLSAREFIAAQAVQSQVTARLTIRHRGDLNAAMRLVDVRTGRIYNPAAFLTDKESGLEYLTIPCSEGVNAG